MPSFRDLHSRLLRAAFAPVDAASLIVLRVVFGAVMIWEVLRYFAKGWIERYYIRPELWFTYYGFDWVRPWPGAGMYVHFVVLGLAALGIMTGRLYRLSAVIFFFGFTYVFLLDQTRYLNHFYLIALLSFLLIFLPVHGNTAPAWALWLFRAQIGIPYFFGGLAKLNADWLRGEPIRGWLADETDFPIIGRFFTDERVVYAFAYGGLLLDLLIVPLLLWRRTRAVAFVVALVFHALNARLFDIGIFPWMMMAATTIFFPPDWPRLWPRPLQLPEVPWWRRRLIVAAGGAWLLVQVLVPLRHLLYPGNVSWTEEGHLFAWHMKLRDKSAEVHFVLTDPDDGSTWEVDPDDLLTSRQTRKMAGHPDLILQFAHHLAREARSEGRARVEVRARGKVSLNGRKAVPLIDPAVNLAEVEPSLRPAPWILPMP